MASSNSVAEPPATATAAAQPPQQQRHVLLSLLACFSCRAGLPEEEGHPVSAPADHPAAPQRPGEPTVRMTDCCLGFVVGAVPVRQGCASAAADAGAEATAQCVKKGRGGTCCVCLHTLATGSTRVMGVHTHHPPLLLWLRPNPQTQRLRREAAAAAVLVLQGGAARVLTARRAAHAA
jgi:hypothetical protein